MRDFKIYISSPTPLQFSIFLAQIGFLIHLFQEQKRWRSAKKLRRTKRGFHFREKITRSYTQSNQVSTNEKCKKNKIKCGVENITFFSKDDGFQSPPGHVPCGRGHPHDYIHPRPCRDAHVNLRPHKVRFECISNFNIRENVKCKVFQAPTSRLLLYFPDLAGGVRQLLPILRHSHVRASHAKRLVSLQCHCFTKETDQLASSFPNLFFGQKKPCCTPGEFVWGHRLVKDSAN